MSPSWLPGLVCLSSYGGNAEIYIQALYFIFKEDFIISRPVFRGRQIGLARYDLQDGKCVTFWHIIQERPIGAQERPDLRRCEKIRWPKPIIENCEDRLIKIWEEYSRKDNCLLLYLEEKEYVVVLSIRKNYYLLKTAYPVTYQKKKQQLLKNYMEYRKKLAPSS
jgi:hypothetical protein